MNKPVRADVDAGQKADARGSVLGLSNEELLSRYEDFIARIVIDTMRACGVDDRNLREDVWADARLGLLRAREMFDEGRGAKFSTYAYYRIKGEIIDGLRRLGHMRRTSRSKSAVARAACLVGEARAEDNYTARPDFMESMASVDRSIRATGVAWLILQTKKARMEERQVAEQPHAQAVKSQTNRRLHEALEHLSAMDRRVVEAIYFEEASLRELSEELGYSRSWLCRVHLAALERIADWMRDE